MNWTWIGTATSLQWKRNELKMWFSDVVFLCCFTKKVFAFFLSHRHTCCESASYAWQEGFSPVTLPSQGYVCVIGAWQEKYASVTPNWLILRLCDGVIGKTRKKYFFSHGDFFFRIKRQTHTRPRKQTLTMLKVKKLKACTCLSNTYTTRTRVVTLFVYVMCTTCVYVYLTYTRP